MAMRGDKRRVIAVAVVALCLALTVGLGVWVLRSRYGLSSQAPIGTLAKVESRLVDIGMTLSRTDTEANGMVTRIYEGSFQKITLVSKATGELVSVRANLRVVATPDESGQATVRIVDLVKDYWSKLAGRLPYLPVVAFSNPQQGIAAMTSSHEDTFQNAHGAGTWTVRELIVHEVVINAPSAAASSTEPGK